MPGSTGQGGDDSAITTQTTGIHVNAGGISAPLRPMGSNAGFSFDSPALWPLLIAAGALVVALVLLRRKGGG